MHLRGHRVDLSLDEAKDVRDLLDSLIACVESRTLRVPDTLDSKPGATVIIRASEDGRDWHVMNDG
jgi:hypothetical protein